MGSNLTLDIGHSCLRASVYDPDDLLSNIFEKNGFDDNANSHFYDSKDGFIKDLSFSSSFMQGKFHFLQFEILNADQFFLSNSFKILVLFLEEQMSTNKNLFDKLMEIINVSKNKPQMFNFKNYSSVNLDNIMTKLKLINSNIWHSPLKTTPIYSTFGYNDFFLDNLQDMFELKIIRKKKYFPMIINAIDFLNNSINDCFFKFTNPIIKDKKKNDSIIAQLESMNPQFFSLPNNLYPYILVSIRSGATFIRVDSSSQFKIIDGSTIGGSTYWGLTRMLTQYENPKEALKEAYKGNNENVDLIVGDIYGGSYASLGLLPDLIASSFGKLKNKKDYELHTIKDEDISQSLMIMLTANTIQIAMLQAQLEGIKNIVMIGSTFDMLEFMRMSEVIFRYLVLEDIHLFFPKHSSFIGSLGVLLKIHQRLRHRIQSI